MKLVRIVDLVGTDVSGMRADIRNRTADGELMYEHQTKDGPKMVTLTRVYTRMAKNEGPTLKRLCGGRDRGQWLRWEWVKSPDVIPFDCGYSGVLAEDETHKDYYILVEGKE